MDGKDGTYISKADKNGNYKWVIISKNKPQSPIPMKPFGHTKFMKPAMKPAKKHAPIKINTPSPIKINTPSPIKINTPSPIKINTPSPNNTIDILKSIKPHLSEIKGLISSIKIGNSKVEKLSELNDNMTIFTNNFIDSLNQSKTSSPAIKTKLKECPETKVLNPKTNRCVDKKSKIGKTLV